jgi:hypothetical protein
MKFGETPRFFSKARPAYKSFMMVVEVLAVVVLVVAVAVRWVAQKRCY